jgi:hypothetical protein
MRNLERERRGRRKANGLGDAFLGRRHRGDSHGAVVFSPRRPEVTPMRNSIWVGLFGFMAGAALFFWKEHQAYVLDVLPWALLLLCPILHIFMHRGHGKRGVPRDHGDHGGGEVSPGRLEMDDGQGRGE